MKKYSKLVTSALGLLACVSLHAEPLADFDAIAMRCTEAFSERPAMEVAYVQPARSWVKRVYAPATLAYRARKTASKISPFVGQIEITEVAAARRGDDEESARIMDVGMDENLIRSVRRINFAYQDNMWTVIGGTSVVEVKRDAAQAFSVADNAKLSREAVLDLKGPMAACVGASRY